MNKAKLKANWKRLPHPIRWIVVGSIGLSLVLAGIVFLFLPGPGIPLLIAGLAVLASEFTWAEVLLHHTKRRVNNLIKKKSSKE